MRIAVFVSGSGSDLQSIIDAVEKKEINLEIALVVASKEGIFALERAKKANIPTAVFDKKEFPTIEFMFDVLLGTLESFRVDFIVLAGYLTVLTKNIVSEYKNRIINIHPSLIPKYCGDGFYGMRVHRAVIENKEKFSGATVHYVDETVDGGKIILQEQISVSEDDTPETLQKRVLALEHILLPKALGIILKKGV